MQITPGSDLLSVLSGVAAPRPPQPPQPPQTPEVAREARAGEPRDRVEIRGEARAARETPERSRPFAPEQPHPRGSKVDLCV